MSETSEGAPLKDAVDPVRYSAIDDKTGAGAADSKSHQKETTLTDDSKETASPPPPRELSDSVDSTISSASELPNLVPVPAAELSTNVTLVHFVRGWIGTGNLAMPYAVAKGGIALAALGIPFVAFLLLYCVNCLITASRLFCKFTGRTRMDYGYTLQFAFEFGPRKFQSFSKYAKKFANVVIGIMQITFCVSYFIFIGDNIRQVVENTLSPGFPVQIYIGLALPVILLVNFIRNIRVLSYVSIVGILVQILGTIIVYRELMGEFQPVSELHLINRNYGEIPVFLGTVVMVFEGITVVLPLENKMASPEEMTSPFGVLNVGVALITIFHTATAFFGYLKYGDDAKGSITLNLPHTPLYASLKVIFAIVVVTSFAVQYFVAHEILFGRIKKWIDDERAHDFWDFVVRAVVITLAATLAASAPFFGPFTALIGALFSTPMGLTIPAIIDLLQRIPRPGALGRYKWRLFWDMFIIVFSIVAAVTGTVTAIREMVLSDKD